MYLITPHHTTSRHTTNSNRNHLKSAAQDLITDALRLSEGIREPCYPNDNKHSRYRPNVVGLGLRRKGMGRTSIGRVFRVGICIQCCHRRQGGQIGIEAHRRS